MPCIFLEIKFKSIHIGHIHFVSCCASCLLTEYFEKVENVYLMLYFIIYTYYWTSEVHLHCVIVHKDFDVKGHYGEMFFKIFTVGSSYIMRMNEMTFDV